MCTYIYRLDDVLLVDKNHNCTPPQLFRTYSSLQVAQELEKLCSIVNFSFVAIEIICFAFSRNFSSLVCTCHFHKLSIIFQQLSDFIFTNSGRIIWREFQPLSTSGRLSWHSKIDWILVHVIYKKRRKYF